MNNAEKYYEADKVITDLKKVGFGDYTSKRDEIMLLFHDELYRGNYDSSTDFDDMPNIRLIQEDEYEQSMSDDEKPEWDTQLSYSAGHYIFPI